MKSFFSLLNKKRARNLLGNFQQFISIILMGGIAMTLFVGLFSNSDSLSSRVEQAYEEGDFPSLYLFTSEGRMEDENRLIRLLDDDDVLDSRLEVTASFGGRPVYLAVTDGMPELSHPYEIEGEFDEERFFFIDSSLGGDTSSLLGTIAVDKPAELEISMAAFSAYLEGIDQSIKDLLEASLLPDKTNPLEADNLVLTLTPTNYMRHPENISMAAYSTSTILISRDYFFSALEQMLSSFFLQGTADIIASMLPGMIEDNLYLIKTDRAGELKERIIAEFEGKDNFLYCLESTEAPWSAAIQVELTEATSLTYLFPFVFFFVALLVILTTFAELIMKERIEIGTLKALGLSSAEIISHYVFLVMALLTVSSVLGFVIGPLSIPIIMGQKYDILYSLPSRTMFVFPALPALLSFFAFLLAGGICAYLVARKQLKLLPSECMRPESRSFRGRSGEEKAKRPSAFALACKMAFRSMRSGLFKSVMVVVGVAGCTALLLCGFGIEDTLDKGIEVDTELAYGSSLRGNYAYNSYERYPSYFGVEGIATANQMYSEATNISFGSKSNLSQAMLLEESHELVKVRTEKGKVSLALQTAEQLGAEVGDVVSFSVLGKPFEMEVAAIYETFSFNGVVGIIDDFAASPVYNAVFLSVEEGVSPSTVKKQIEEAAPDLFSSLQTKEETLEQVRSIVSGISVMTNAVKVFAILLALVVLYNLALLSFRTRFREIATLKVLGFSFVEIGVSLILEALLLSAIGFSLGCLFGFPFMYATLKVNEVSLVRFLYTLSPLSYVYAFLLTFGVSFVVNLYTSFLARKVRMVESLKSVE